MTPSPHRAITALRQRPRRATSRTTRCVNNVSIFGQHRQLQQQLPPRRPQAPHGPQLLLRRRVPVRPAPWTPAPVPTTRTPTSLAHRLSYGRSDFNFGKALKIYGLWQPVFFKGAMAAREARRMAGPSRHLQHPHRLPLHRPTTTSPEQSLYCSQRVSAPYDPPPVGGGVNVRSNNAFTQRASGVGTPNLNFPQPRANQIPLRPAHHRPRSHPSSIPNFKGPAGHHHRSTPPTRIPSSRMSPATPSTARTTATSTPPSPRTSACPTSSVASAKAPV